MTPDRIDRGGHAVTAFIAGDDAQANATVAELAASAGFAPLITGALHNARYLEAMAHLNIQIAVVGGGGTNAGFVSPGPRLNGRRAARRRQPQPYPGAGTAGTALPGNPLPNLAAPAVTLRERRQALATLRPQGREQGTNPHCSA